MGYSGPMPNWVQDKGVWWDVTPRGRFRGEEVECPCGKAFIRRVSPTGRNGPARYCSRTCSNQLAPNDKRFRQGPDHPNWQGGRSVSSRDGYVLVKEPGGKYQLEHRKVMEEHLGRELLSTETVHHKNGIRDDNRIENLQLFSSRHVRGASFQCIDCGSMNVKPL